MNKKHFYAAVILLSFLAVGIQPVLATIYIPGDTSYYDAVGNMYTLKVDVYGTINIALNGITLDGGGNTIKPSAAESTHGIFVLGKTDVTIQNVIIQKNEALPPLEQGFDIGIAIQQCDNITLTGNNISGCDRGSFSSGIDLSLTYLSDLTSNDVSYNSIGIRLSNSYSNVDDGNTLTNNTVSHNDEYAIYLTSSNYNTLTFNTISDNYRGLRILSGSNGNYIYNNNFINTFGFHAAVTDSTGNVFNLDLSEGGNYWDDWTSPDADNNGIVDNAYTGIYVEDGDPPILDDLPWANQNGWITPPTPPTPQEEIVELIFTVESLNLQNGIDNSLDAKLDAAFNALDDINQNNNAAAINSLNAFINAVEAQRDNKLTSAEADGLIADAQNIIDLL